jgi:hypothetical protein
MELLHPTTFEENQRSFGNITSIQYGGHPYMPLPSVYDDQGIHWFFTR